MASIIKADTLQSTTANVFVLNSSGTEYARFDSSGNLGIGTSSPGYKLDISTASASNGLGINLTNSGSTGAGINFLQSGVDSFFVSMPAGTGGLKFVASGTNERMRIDSSGNVGIGTASPETKLHLFSSSAVYLQFTDSGDGASRVGQNGTALTFGVDGSSGTTEVGRFDSAGLFKFNSGYGSVATAYGCRAWVNFNGTGAVAIRASGNVSSITDNGVGDYSINFTAAMPDANYSVVGTAKIVGGTGGQNIRIHNDAYTTSVTTSAVKIQVTNNGNNATADSEMVNLTIFR